MKKGDTVTIYEDPISEKKPEGEAELLRKLGHSPLTSWLEYWEVKFLDDGFKTARFIKIR